MQEEIELERNQSAKLANEKNTLQKHIEDLQQTYSKNRDAIAAMESLGSEARAVGNRKGVFVGAYIPNELKDTLRLTAAMGKRTLSQEITRALYNSALRHKNPLSDPDYLDMTAERYVDYLAMQRIGVNLGKAKRDSLIEGRRSGSETHESALRKIESLKDTKLREALNRIIKILERNDSETERIIDAKAAAIDVLLVPEF